MFSLVRDRFGIPGAISVVALVFAMFGGAYAASNSGGGHGKATVSKAGKRGPRGPKGPAGPPGQTGPAGAQGAAGSKGNDGAPGAPGQDGVSAESVAFSGEKGNCKEGGIEVKSASSPSLVCNGKKGTNGTPGAPGEPWTPNGTLPAGATETGAWTFHGLPSGSKESYSGIGEIWVPISFPIKLAAALDASGCVIQGGQVVGPCQVHFIEQNGMERFLKVPEFETVEVTPPSCHGSAAEPSADPGNLCVYAGSLSAAFPGVQGFHIQAIQPVDGSGAEAGASTAGAKLRFSDFENSPAGEGTWAVTG